jgi:hypothetical protein
MRATFELRVLLAVICLMAGGSIWMTRSASQLRAQVYTTSVLSGIVLSNPVDPDDSTRTRLDLNGNEIDDAVGDYRVDHGGDLYERHAPEEIVIHLGPPKS